VTNSGPLDGGPRDFANMQRDRGLRKGGAGSPALPPQPMPNGLRTMPRSSQAWAPLSTRCATV
jgi:hypothetical protein